MADARLSQQPAPRPRRTEARLVRRGHRRADRALRCPRRRSRRGAAAGQCRRRGRRGARVVGPLPGPLLRRSAARRPRRRRHAGRRLGPARRRARVAGGGHAPGAVPRARGLPRARGARLHRRGPHARRPAAAQALHCGPVLQDAGRDGRGVRRPARRARQLGRDRTALQPDDSAGQEPPARLSRARGRHARRSSEERSGRRPGAAPCSAVPRSAGARREALRVRRAAGLRDEDDHPDGLRRLLPDRRRLHQLGQGQRCPGRPRPRLRRRLARRVRARHHRSRSHPLRAAVRAFPQSRARVDAGLRHRLLPGRPRSRHRLREEEIRRGLGLADRDLRHDGREGGGPRRRPRARPPLPVLRRHREADPVPARPADHARRGARAGAAARGARAEGGGGARAPGARRFARGAHAQRRHARRRRADRAGQAHRLLSRSTRSPDPTRSSRSSTRTTSRRSASSSSTSSASPRSRSSTGRCAT